MNTQRPRLSDQLRRIIEDTPMTRYRIGKLTGIDQAVLSKFVRGERGLSTDSWDRLGELLKLRLVAEDRPEKRKGR